MYVYVYVYNIYKQCCLVQNGLNFPFLEQKKNILLSKAPPSSTAPEILSCKCVPRHVFDALWYLWSFILTDKT